MGNFLGGSVVMGTQDKVEELENEIKDEIKDEIISTIPDNQINIADQTTQITDHPWYSWFKILIDQETSSKLKTQVEKEWLRNELCKFKMGFSENPEMRVLLEKLNSKDLPSTDLIGIPENVFTRSIGSTTEGFFEDDNYQYYYLPRAFSKDDRHQWLVVSDNKVVKTVEDLFYDYLPSTPYTVPQDFMEEFQKYVKPDMLSFFDDSRPTAEELFSRGKKLFELGSIANPDEIALWKIEICRAGPIISKEVVSKLKELGDKVDLTKPFAGIYSRAEPHPLHGAKTFFFKEVHCYVRKDPTGYRGWILYYDSFEGNSSHGQGMHSDEYPEIGTPMPYEMPPYRLNYLRKDSLFPLYQPLNKEAPLDQSPLRYATNTSTNQPWIKEDVVF